MHRTLLCLFLSVLPLFLFLPAASAGDHGMALGYGFAAYNKHSPTGRTEGGAYDFLQVAYVYENRLGRKVSFVVEPFAAYVNKPTAGVDAGFDLRLRWYAIGSARKGLYVDVGAGAAYTSVSFREQDTHLLGILAGGIGFRYKKFFVENRFRHYSNGNTGVPNRSVNTNIVSAGLYF